MGLDPQGYGNPDFCWLSLRDTLIWSFVGPVGAVIIVSGARVQQGGPPPCSAGLPVAEPVAAASVAFAGELGSLCAVGPRVLSEEAPVLRAQSGGVSEA